MKKFILEAEVTISLYTKVEAESLDEAIQIAQDRPIEKGEWGNSDQDQEAWISDEYDGEVQNIHEQ